MVTATGSGEWPWSTVPRAQDDLAAVDTPAVVVDVDRLEANISRISTLAADDGLDLRPHVKTHKSVAIGTRQLDSGAAGFTVSKLDELAGFRKLGVPSFLVAYPLVTPLKARRLLEFQAQLDSHIQVGVDSLAGAVVLSIVATDAERQINVLIEIDCGLGRCGVSPRDAGDLAAAVAALPGISVEGVFTHAGHAYKAVGPDEVKRVAVEEADAARFAADGLRRSGVDVSAVSIGSTPTFLQRVDRRGITEARPGNYVFFDRGQVSLGSAEMDECALTVLSTVVSSGDGRAVVDAGSKVFGLDRGAHGIASLEGFGADVERGVVVAWLSEEHGVIDDPDGRLAVGDRLRFVPNHSCVTANLADELVMVRGSTVESVVGIDSPGGGR